MQQYFHNSTLHAAALLPLEANECAHSLVLVHVHRVRPRVISKVIVIVIIVLEIVVVERVVRIVVGFFPEILIDGTGYAA